MTGEDFECKDLSVTCIHDDECCTECCRKGICGNNGWLGRCIVDCIKSTDADQFTCSGDDECCSGICNSDHRCEEKTNMWLVWIGIIIVILVVAGLAVGIFFYYKGKREAAAY